MYLFVLLLDLIPFALCQQHGAPSSIEKGDKLS